MVSPPNLKGTRASAGETAISSPDFHHSDSKSSNIIKWCSSLPLFSSFFFSSTHLFFQCPSSLHQAPWLEPMGLLLPAPPPFVHVHNPLKIIFYIHLCLCPEFPPLLQQLLPKVMPTAYFFLSIFAPLNNYKLCMQSQLAERLTFPQPKLPSTFFS